MDERSFDNLLKRKLENYSDPYFDEDGFGDLKKRLVALPKSNQISKGVLYTAVSSMVLLTALNIYLVFFYNKTNQYEIQNKLTLSGFQTKIDSLTDVIHKMDKDQQHVVRHELIDLPNEQVVVKNGNYNTSLPVVVYDTVRVFVGAVQDHVTESSSQVPEIVLPIAVRKVEPFNREISLAMRNKIEQHYFRGLGINLGVHVAPMLPSMVSGNGSMSVKTGIVSDWILSPRLSIEAGADYSTIRVRTGEAGQVPEKYRHSTYGNFGSATVSTSLASLPLSFKYRQWMTSKMQAFVKVGYVPYFSLARRYKLNYNDGGGLPDYDDRRNITQLGKEECRTFYSNNLSFAVGITRQLKKGKVDLNLFYEKAVTSNVQGAGNFQLLGLSAGYWLRVR